MTTGYFNKNTSCTTAVPTRRRAIHGGCQHFRLGHDTGGGEQRVLCGMLVFICTRSATISCVLFLFLLFVDEIQHLVKVPDRRTGWMSVTYSGRGVLVSFFQQFGYSMTIWRELQTVGELSALLL